MVWSRSWFRWSAPPSMTKYQEARKALEPTSYPRLQDFLDTLQSFARRALTIRYSDSSVDSNIPGTSLDQGARCQSFQNPFSRDRDRANVASIIIRFYIDAGKPSKGPSRRALKIRDYRGPIH